MDGKLLVLCDEIPGAYNDGYKDYKIRDNIFFKEQLRYPEDDTDIIFVSWDSIIPEDRAFIEACKYYSRFEEKPEPNFILSQRGSIDPARGTIKGSVQEQSYYDTYSANLNYLSRLAQKGEDWNAERLELMVQYPFDANERFLEEFSKILENEGVVRVLPTFSENSEKNITAYRKNILQMWNDRNKLNKQMNREKYVPVKVLDEAIYSDFREILYKRSTEEIMQIYSLPIFGETEDSEYDDGPEL